MLEDQGTWIDLVRKHWPGISDGDAGDVLFMATCFPFGKPETVEQQLIEKYNQSKGNPQVAMAIAVQELDEAFAEYQRQQREE